MGEEGEPKGTRQGVRKEMEEAVETLNTCRSPPLLPPNLHLHRSVKRWWQKLSSLHRRRWCRILLPPLPSDFSCFQWDPRLLGFARGQSASTFPFGEGVFLREDVQVLALHHFLSHVQGSDGFHVLPFALLSLGFSRIAISFSDGFEFGSCLPR
ncbi:hypothetical protein QN277_003892 [Acacia crassicarpa]|uniref:Uncharacterized protein n=1 Tax=Acacia crassicarpa TaxID=499986 RepID=A0AAE1MBA6_9FABA|nr:hypothetical protein QN277_003892 [Acacia crassicarpa]